MAASSSAKGGPAGAEPRRTRARRTAPRGKAAAPDASREHALLVTLLNHAMPPGRAASAGAAILREFGDIASALAAGPARLKALPAVSRKAAALLGAVQEAAVEFSIAHRRDRPRLANVQDILDHLAGASEPVGGGGLRVLFLDAGNRLLADERLGAQNGAVVAVHPGEVVRRALHWNASALVLAHTHPAGEAAPDEDEVLLTHDIQRLAEDVGIVVHDHVVMAGGAQVSMRRLGLMRGLLRAG